VPFYKSAGLVAFKRGFRKKMKMKEIKDKSIEELEGELENLKKESFNLRFQKAGGQLENTSRVRFVRRTIARILTVLNSKVEKV
jgi:large subunit ribosomal protein L29